MAVCSHPSITAGSSGRIGIHSQISAARPASSSASACAGRIGSSRMCFPVNVIGPSEGIEANTLEGPRHHEKDDDHQ